MGGWPLNNFRNYGAHDLSGNTTNKYNYSRRQISKEPKWKYVPIINLDSIDKNEISIIN
jgi:hypothetical protein